MRIRGVVAIACIIAAVAAATAAPGLRAMSLFGDGMVLQSSNGQGKHARLWGEAAPGATVTLSVDGSVQAHAQADADGAWSLDIARAPSGPHELLLSSGGDTGGNSSTSTNGASLHASNVYFGMVLICSGQSNLEFNMGQIDNSTDEIAAASDARLAGRIRLFSAPDNATFPANSSARTAAHPQRYLPHDCSGAGCGDGAPSAGTWFAANASTVARFSALCYLAARDIVLGSGSGSGSNEEEDEEEEGGGVVWGLVQSAKGGTPIQGWLPGDQLQARMPRCGMNPAWPIFTQSGDSGTIWSRPATLWNQMMAPIAGFQATAILWDQGEANMDEGYMLRREQYACLFREMIAGWREAWGDAALPFVFPQLHACGSQKNECTNAACAPGSWTTIRSAQDDVARTVSGVGMAVAYDMGFKGVHSPHKQAVARRLALQLRRVALQQQPAESGAAPTLLGACVQQFDAATNTTTVRVALGGTTTGLRLNDTFGCSDCCGPAGNAGMFAVSMASSYGGEVWTTGATVAVDAASDPPALVVTAAMGNMAPGGKQLRVFGLRYATGNLPQCAVLNGYDMPLAPFNAATIAPACVSWEH